ncbi:hypothetical protein [Acinetobacter sp. M5A5_2a]
MTTDIQQWRSSICEQLIRSGKNDIEDIIKDASRLEVYVFGETKTAEAKPETKNAEVKTSKPAKTETVKAEPVEEVKPTETAQVEEVTQTETVDAATTTITKKEVTDACMAVAKKDRSKLLKILEKVGAASVPTIKEEDYAAVIDACEKALA